MSKNGNELLSILGGVYVIERERGGFESLPLSLMTISKIADRLEEEGYDYEKVVDLLFDWYEEDRLLAAVMKKELVN